MRRELDSIELIVMATYLKVHVIPESREEAVVEKEGILYLSVRKKAEQGAANRRILELVREYLGGLPGKRLKIVSGHHAPHKIISMEME